MTDETIKEMKPCDFGKFQFKRVLNEDSYSKTTFLEGTFDNEDPAVVILEKTPFSEEHSSKVLKVSHEDTKQTFQNDIYSGYKLDSKIANEIKATVIYPATQKHIEKYSKQHRYLIKETPELYRDKVAPFIDKNAFSVKWVYNVLEKKEEQESVLFEDEDQKMGFMLCKDMKWDMVSTSDLHMLAIVHDRTIRSIRDLRASHLDMLKNIRDKSKKFIQEKYALNEDQIMMYFHYQPTYYHLHLHVVATSFEKPPGGGCERGHILDVVISNLEISGDYYEKATLCYALNQNEPLRKALRGDEGDKP